jgi:hypothetical protein
LILFFSTAEQAASYFFGEHQAMNDKANAAQLSGAFA